MFRGITSIQNFGVFHNFAGAGLPQFRSVNLIYGWNYSGKTTLSRVFRCLENGTLHPDYPAARFKFTADGDIIYDEGFGPQCNVRVFNEDFRKENLLWDDDDGFNPVLLAGSQNIRRLEELELKQREREELLAASEANKQEIQRLEGIVSSAETDCARQISQELPVGRFDRRKLTPIIDEWGDQIPKPIGANVVQAERAKVIAEKKDLLSPLPDFLNEAKAGERAWLDANSLLSEQIGSTVTIQRLVDNPELGRWVEKGRDLHIGNYRCEFCDGKLSKERLAALNAHFSDEFENLQRKITRAIDQIKSGKIVLPVGAYTKSAFYADLHEEFDQIHGSLAEAIAESNSIVQGRIDSLENKQANPFEIVEAPKASNSMHEVLKQAYSAFQDLIDQNNRRTEEFSLARDRAIDVLKGHYTAEAMRKIDRFGVLKKTNEHRETEKESLRKISEIDGRISSLEAELSEATKGAEAINENLERFFGKNDIQVKVTEDDRFALMRGAEPARNLSEGERTAIAFCYFVTKLLENGNDLSDTIVYIDDPISSLDSHHLIHVNAFIKNTFYRYDSQGNPKHTCRAKQLFISTHNYEFFHLTWEWMSKGKKKGFAAAYLVQRNDSGGIASSRLIECPISITRYRSEYLFLYHQLAAYRSEPSNDAQVIFNIGNMARRFVEGYLSFKLFEHAGIDQSLEQLIDDPINCERARKFMHFYSHSLSRAGGMNLPDMSEAQSIVGIILDSLKAHDPIHYGALEAIQLSD